MWSEERPLVDEIEKSIVPIPLEIEVEIEDGLKVSQ